MKLEGFSALDIIDPNYADITKCENPPLHFAILKNKFCAVFLLLSFHNINLRKKNFSGLTPLALCRQENRKELYSIIACALRNNKDQFKQIAYKHMRQHADFQTEIIDSLIMNIRM